jgi:CubicO group peptidase (beta-lactamase class C family)
MMRRASLALLLALATWGLAPVASAEALPILSETGPDAAAYGAAAGYPPPAPGQPVDQAHMVGFYSRYEQVRRLLRTVPRGETVSAFRRATMQIAPRYVTADRGLNIADYLARNPATGLLILRGDEILYEHYQYGRTPADRFVSQSMVKTITGLLVGIAVAEGKIRSVDDPAAAYVPELAGTEYGATPLRALLTMSSGVAYRETYDGNDDNARLGRALFPADAPGAVAAVRQFNTRDASPGARFYYSGAETEVLGLVVARATGMSLSDYLSTKIWRRIGMESDAAWAIDPTGQEVAYCCFIATLRDWGRLGRLLAQDGVWEGEQIIPRAWLLAATTVAPGDERLAPGRATPGTGYGYQLWIQPGERRVFSLIGIHGQRMLVDPASGLVLVQTAVRVRPGDPGTAELLALWNAVVAQYAR